MNHFTTPEFWKSYSGLPLAIQDLADKSFALLKDNPQHPSLHFKKVGVYWSVRVNENFRALAIEHPQGLLWFWIGIHDKYDRKIHQSSDD